ncbi:hypothetical protein ANCDUO_00257 [Ancylostoma duodenale]|uniref:Uncharacterized protein n=1 Tax=Ancylostoma duodenale TaxID=51022 RepID=A0A0C2E1Y2_9BILA|nr:hypothetical protein ANCDUO_00257 [Ancylostoma duodenale]
MRLIRSEVNAHTQMNRHKMKEFFDTKHKVDPGRHPKLAAEKTKSKHRKLTFNWDGPYRVIEITDNSALVTKIGVYEGSV